MGGSAGVTLLPWVNSSPNSGAGEIQDFHLGATREQRGLRSRGIIHEIAMDDDTYCYPPLVMKFLNKVLFFQHISYLEFFSIRKH